MSVSHIPHLPVVPFVDLRQQYASLKQDMDQAIQSVLASAEFIGGNSVDQFEREFARSLNIPFCIGVGNGTDALWLSLKALGIGPGDAVITPANTFIASAEAITLAGARPLFVDCDPETYLLNFDHLEKILNQAQQQGVRVRAILPVHLYGQAVAMDRLLDIARQWKLFIVEDCAQAHGAKYKNQSVGTFGDVGCFSFFPGKNLGAYGDAGAIVTRNPELAEKLRKMRNHGCAQKYEHLFEGTNSRLDALQAAILSVKLPHLEKWNALRVQHARQYLGQLGSLKELNLPTQANEEGRHVFHLFVIRHTDRDRLKKALERDGIMTGVHYPVALPNSPAYRHLGYTPGDFPIASAYQNQILSLPMFPELTSEQILYVGERLQHHLNDRTA